MRTPVVAVALAACLCAGEKKKERPSALDRFVQDAVAADAISATQTTGSLWSAASPFSDLAADLRARRLHDAVTIVVRERASAVARGTVKSSRASSASAGINSILGPRDPSGRLPNLLDLGSTQQLDGQGETSRETLLTTTLSARVVQVLPNGDLVVQSSKTVRINSEMQTVEVRGIVRPYDISPANTILSDQLSFLEVSVDGKGVVNDAVRRPNFLYRLLLGLLPF